MSVYNIRKWETFRKLAAISGIVQGLTWLVMASICIGMYYGEAPHGFKSFSSTVITEKTSYLDLISFSFYDTLLYTYHNNEDRALKPQNFHIFAWLYAIFSGLWLGFAISECLALFRKKPSKYDVHVTMIIGIGAFIVCLLDLIVASLVLKDYVGINVFEYGDVLDWNVISTTSTSPTTTSSDTSSPTTTSSDPSSPTTTSSDMSSPTTMDPHSEFIQSIDVVFRYKIGRKLTYGILLTICLRGFIIWIFNFVSGIVLLTLSIQMFRAPPILKYDNRSIPRAKIDESVKDNNSFFGQGFAEDYADLRSTPPSEKKGYSVPPGPSNRYYERELNNPLALNEKNRRNENRFS